MSLSNEDCESVLALLMAEYGGERADWTEMRSFRHVTDLVDAIVQRAVAAALTEAADAIEQRRYRRESDWDIDLTERDIYIDAADIVRKRIT